MAMSKKQFIALADAIRAFDGERHKGEGRFSVSQLWALAAFCQKQNPNFDRDRWLGYIAGENGPNGGKIS